MADERKPAGGAGQPPDQGGADAAADRARQPDGGHWRPDALPAGEAAGQELGADGDSDDVADSPSKGHGTRPLPSGRD